MVFGYFDESFDKTAPDIKTRAFCGLIARDQTWRYIDERWWATLNDPVWPTRPKFFHAVDCANGNGEFTAWSYTYRLMLLARLYDILIDSDALACGVCILPYAFIALPAFIQRQFGAPDLTMMQHAIQTTIGQAAHRFPGSEVGLVFNEDDQITAQKAKWLFETYHADPNDHRWEKWTLFKLSPARDVSMLQAADLLAYGSYRFHEENLSERERDLRMGPLMLRMVDKMSSTGQAWDKESLLKLYLSNRAIVPSTSTLLTEYIKDDVLRVATLDPRGRTV